MKVQKFEGVWKMAQHRSEADRLGVIQGLTEAGEPHVDVAEVMTRLESDR